MADEQLNYRVNEILRIATGLVTAVKEIRDVQDEHSRKLDENTKEIASLKTDVSSYENRCFFYKRRYKNPFGTNNRNRAEVLEIDKRLTAVENRLDSIETRMTTLEDEVKQVRIELGELKQRVEEGFEMKARIDDLNSRVEKLEEKVFA